LSKSEGFEKPTGGSKPRSSLDNPLRGLSADDEGLQLDVLQNRQVAQNGDSP